MIVTLGGTPGSGKSKVAEYISEKTGYTRIYMGNLQRELARKENMTLEKLQEMEEKDPSWDLKVDEYMRKIVCERDNLLVEGKAAAGLFRKWGIEKEAIHVYIFCSPETGAERIYNQKQEEGAGGRNEDDVLSVKEQMEKNGQRMESESIRYKKYYGFDNHDTTLYDIVIDTTSMTKEEEPELCYQQIKKRAKEKFNIDLA